MMLYLLHYHDPHPNSVNGAAHYLGWAKTSNTLVARVARHRSGTSGCHFTTSMALNNRDFVVANVFVDGEKAEERAMKEWHRPKRFCPICNARATVPYELKPMDVSELVRVNTTIGTPLGDDEIARLREWHDSIKESVI